MKRPFSFLLIWPLMVGAASRSFDGTGDNLDMGNVLNVTTNDVSTCVWWKGTEDAGGDRLIGKKNDDNATTAGYSLRQNSADFVQFQASDATDNCNASGATTDTDASWFYVCGVWNSATTGCAAYVNAVEEVTATNASTGSLSNAVDFQMGEDAAGGNDANGLMAYGQVYLSTVLTIAQQSERMWYPMLLPSDGLWPAWGQSPEQDLSGNNNDGTVNNATTSADGPPVMIGTEAP